MSNIGWALSKATAVSMLANGESSYDRKIMKCAGALQCINEDCEQGYNVDTRPQLPFISIFHFPWEKKELNKSVKETPDITAAAAIAGIDPATGAIKRSIKNINKVLGKHGCAIFEINHSKIKQGIILSANNVVAEFEDPEKHYDSAQILYSKFFVSFCSPGTVKSELPFADQPIITDTATEKDDSERGLPRADSDGFDDHPENEDEHSEQEDLLYSISGSGKRFRSAVSSLEDAPECLKNPLHMQSRRVYL